jgi:hypothetical protein
MKIHGRHGEDRGGTIGIEGGIEAMDGGGKIRIGENAGAEGGIIIGPEHPGDGAIDAAIGHEGDFGVSFAVAEVDEAEPGDADGFLALDEVGVDGGAFLAVQGDGVKGEASGDAIQAGALHNFYFLYLG